VVEGATDTAAGLSLGYYAVGRPAASGGVSELKHLFRLKGVRRAVIVSDNDEVGFNGAKMVQDHLSVPSCLITLPCKDLREFVMYSGDRRLLQHYIDSSIWKQPHY
jgi:DNA primase